MLRTNQTPISSTNQGLATAQNPDGDAKLKFKAFLKEFNMRNERIYHDRVMSHLNLQRFHLQVQLLHLKSFDEYLFDLIKEQPLYWIRVLQKTLQEYVESIDGRQTVWQLQLTSEEEPIRLRQINSYSANKLITTSGIVVKATRPFIKGKRIALKCNRCANRMSIECQIGQSPQIPRSCLNSRREVEPCGLDSMKIISHDSTVQNYQKIILQEYPQDIPKGETPRTYELMLERHNSGVLTPGERIRVTGVLLLKERERGIKGGYLWGCGMYRDRQTQDQKFSIEQEEQFKLFSKDPNLHQKIYSYIAPKIYGNKDIKEAISCQLFGGSRKTLPDNTKLRGDINVLLVGDPSTAKSQFLIFAQKLAAISVYTSGKGSSAAGLTASINKDPNSGQFQVQAGALVRADGGLVCIDQFDKMRPQDRVAIHEAMQQQTISVAKAGITSRLNSRCSILAAANPIMGRYDDFKQITEQINLV